MAHLDFISAQEKGHGLEVELIIFTYISLSR
jgi:hypothetical protein